MLPELLVIQHVDREGPDRIADWACAKGSRSNASAPTKAGLTCRGNPETSGGRADGRAHGGQ